MKNLQQQKKGPKHNFERVCQFDIFLIFCLKHFYILFAKLRMGLNTSKFTVVTDPILFLNLNPTKRINFIPYLACKGLWQINNWIVLTWHSLIDWATAVAWITIAWITIAGIAIDRVASMPPLGSRFRCWFWFWFWFWFWCSFHANEKEDTNTKN